MPDKKYPINGTKEEKYLYVYEKAKSLGDKFPEVTASQFALESNFGESEHAKNLNNPFGQTEVGDTLKNRKFKKYNSIDDAISYRVKKWSPKYKDASNPIEAIAKIQPSYAPSADKNNGYINSVATHMKNFGFYNGDLNLPNADQSPDFYDPKKRTFIDKKYVYKKEVAKQEYDKFQKKLVEIEKMDIPEQLKAQKRNEAQIQIQKNGLLDNFNEIINEENQKQADVFNKEVKTKLDDINQLLAKTEFEYVEANGKKEVISVGSIKASDYKSKAQFSKIAPGSSEINFTNAQVKELMKKFPGAITLNKNADSGQLGVSYNVDLDKLNNEYKKMTKEWTGQEVALFDKGADGKLYKNKNVDFDINFFDGRSIGKRLGMANSAAGVFIPKVDTKGLQLNRPRKSPLQPLPFNDSVESTTEETTTTTQIPSDSTGGINPTDATSSVVEAEIAKRKAEDIKETPTDFFMQEMNVPTVDGEAQYKDTFPYAEVLGNAVGAITGIGMAKEKIPMRDEQVSDAFRNYAAELSKLSQIGLRPEDEAYAKRMLAESYQGSIEAMVQASGGNRNLVLGNMGRIDSQKQKGLMEIALADGAAKTEALHKYGEAMQYINEFDANRDIANNERKYLSAIKTKEAGAQLASASFSAMLDSIENYKANAPGSANHMYKSYMYKELMGFDPQIKDDRTGNIPYSYSWYKKQQEGIASKAKEFNAYREKFYALDSEKQMQVTKFMEKNLNQKDYFGFIDYLSKNNPEGKYDESNYSEAIKSGDFGKLYQMGKESDTKPEKGDYTDGLIGLTPEQLANDGPMSFGKPEMSNVPQTENKVDGNTYTGAIVNQQSGGFSIDTINEKKKNGLSLTEDEMIFEKTYNEMKPTFENNFGKNQPEKVTSYDEVLKKENNINSEFDKYWAEEDARKKKELEQIQKQQDYQKQIELVTGKKM